MPYQVSYKSDTIPTNLPEGATVEKISSLPATIRTAWSRKIEVEESPAFDSSAFITIREIGTYETDSVAAALSKDNAREIAHALLEAIGEPIEARVLGVGSRVKIVHDDNYYTGRWAVGMTGTIREDLDDDGDYYVKIDDEGSVYAKPDQLAFA